jgi:ferredoxin-NADP reductase
MTNSRVAGLVLAAMFVVPAAAFAQSTEVAYATAPKSEFVVFLDNNGQMSPVANATVHKAAVAARSARTIYVIGRGDYADAVKAELTRNGIPANAIEVTARADNPLPKAADGLRDPMIRRVEISF